MLYVVFTKYIINLGNYLTRQTMKMSVNLNTDANYRFLQMYEMINTQILTKDLLKKESSDSNKILFEIIFHLLLKKFLNNKNLSSAEVLPRNILFEKHTHARIEEIYTTELIEKFEFSLEENFSNEIENQITPLIFSHLFEYSRLAKIKQKQGIFYTSNIVVDFMCKEALTVFLKQNTDLEIEQILSLLWKNDFERLTEEQIITVKNKLLEIEVIDPACGSGAFLLGICNLIVNILFNLERNINNQPDILKICSSFISNNIFGLDIDREAISISKLRLILFQLSKCEGINDLRKITKNSNIAQIDSLLYSEEEIIEYPFVDQEYDLVIGNPPFIRQELFASQENKLNKLQFETNKSYKEEIISSLEKFFKQSFEIPLYLKGDFYIYFYYRGLSLLKTNGVLCFITSNSWLDAKFGLVFQEFLLQNFNLNFVYTNLINKSFNASINTAIALISKSEITDGFIRFVAFNDDLECILDEKNLTLIHKHKSREILLTYKIHSILQAEISELAKKDKDYKGVKLGALFLRAPPLYHKLIEMSHDKITTLGKLGKLRYPLKTGINDFFYLTDDIAQKFNIEKEFLIPVVKSPKKIKTLDIDDEEIYIKLFTCFESQKILKERRRTGALSYIEWGANQVTESKQQTTKGVRWPDIPSVQFHRPGWYSVRMVKFADIFCNRFIDRRFFFCKSDSKVIEDQTFYGLIIEDEKQDKDLIHALLNSTLTYFFLELFGRSSLGRGAVQYAIDDYITLPIINPSSMPKNLQNDLKKKFQLIKSREILSIFNEVKREDRLEFDQLLFNWLGLAAEEVEQFYESFIQLVSQRIKKSGQKLP